MRRVALVLAVVLAVSLVPVHSAARTWHIYPDGSGDARTIPAGIDSAVSGDTVLVGCGVYHEYDVEMKSGITLRSETGEAECVSIEAYQQDRVFCCQDVDSAASIEGFAIVEGSAEFGGGIFFENSFLSEYDLGFYRPMQTVSFMFDAMIGGNDAFIYHTTNLILHFLTCCMISLNAPSISFVVDRVCICNHNSREACAISSIFIGLCSIINALLLGEFLISLIKSAIESNNSTDSSLSFLKCSSTTPANSSFISH